MSDNHDLLNDNDMCSFSGHEAEDMCFNCGDHTCGDGMSRGQTKTGYYGEGPVGCGRVPQADGRINFGE